MSCNQNCNQGRNCRCKEATPEYSSMFYVLSLTAIAVVSVAAIAIMF